MRRTFSRLFVLVTLLVVVAFAPAAEAVLSAVSPGLNGFGFPLWYQDANAVRLQQCMDPVNCIVLADAFFNPALPLVFPTNFPGESFYFFAGARIDTIGPQVLGGATQRNLDLRVVLEASFGGALGAPVPGEQITFARINLGRITGGPNCGIAPINPLDCVLAPGATYTVTYPYGTFTFTADANGEAISSLGGQAFRQVDGCGVPPFPCNFTVPLAAPYLGPGFLTALAPPPPAGFIGNAAVLQTVTGSPFGTNFFRIDGPNIGGPGVNTIQVNNWTLAGQLAAGPTIVTHIASGDFNNDGTGDIAAVDAAGAVWFSVAAGIWGQVTNPVGVSFLNGKLITGDFNNARLGDEIAALTADGRVFVSNDMLTFTEILRPVGIILADIHAGDFNAARLGDEIAGLALSGRIVIAATNTTFAQTPTGTLAKLAVGNLNGAGTTDLVGLSAAGKIWVSLDLGATWQQVIGTLAQMTTGDVNGDGVDDILGVSSIGKIWYTTDLLLWNNPVGTLAKLTAGPFQTTIPASDQIGGLSAARKIWVLINPSPATPVWVNPPGTADQVVPLKPGPGMAALNAATGKAFTTPNLTTWTVRN